MRSHQTPASRSRLRILAPVLLLVALPGAFLFPYLFLGRSMVPLDMLPGFQPWVRHAASLWPAEVWTPGQLPHNPLLDSIQQYFPRRVYFSGALSGGWLPLWNPYVYAGSPFAGIQQGALLYPPAWLLALFPPEQQFGWSAFLHLSLAAVGSYLFFRQMELRRAAAVAGGVAFAFNGFIVVWLAYPNVTQWTLCWLPLALFLWEKGRERDDLRWIAGSAAALGLSLLGGHAQSSAYVLLVWAAWALYRCLTSGRPLSALARWAALPGTLAVLFALGQLLPAFDYLPRTDRSGRLPWEAVLANGMPPNQLWTLILPRLFGDETAGFGTLPSWLNGYDTSPYARLAFLERSFYPGAAVLVLAAGAWAARRLPPEYRRLALFSLVLAVGGIAMALFPPLYWPLWRFAPGFGHLTAWARIICIAAWGLAGLAALGVHALGDADPLVRRSALRGIAAAAALGAVVAIAGYILHPVPLPVDETLQRQGLPAADPQLTRDLLLALGWLLLPVVIALLSLPLQQRQRPVLQPALAAAAAVVVIAADLFTFGFGFNPRADPRFLTAQVPELQAVTAEPEAFRFLSVGPGPDPMRHLHERMPSNLPSVFGLADALGSDSFVSKRYRQWERALSRATGEGPWSRPGAANLRAAGVRYYLTGAKEPFSGLEEVVGTGLQRDPRALPYARLHPFAQALPSEAAVLENLANPNRSPLVALVAGPDAPTFSNPGPVTPFTVRRRNGNRLVLEGEAPSSGLLVVAEQYEPGWRVAVNGRPARLFPADHLFVGVPLEAGPQVVELTYQPAPWRVGLFGTLAALGALCALLVGARPRRPAKLSTADV
ncbi:MAG: YfhO family protein [Armatimonadota bacterium]